VQWLGLAGVVAIAATPMAGNESSTAPAAPDISLFAEAASPDEKRARVALDALAASWRDGYAALIIDLARFMRSGRPHDVPGENVPLLADDGGAVTTGRSGEAFARARRPDPSSFVRARLLRFLEKRTGQRHGDDLRAWRRWIWSLDHDPHPDYGLFKAILYSRIDARMAAFFPPGVRSNIRLDEVDWGGVTVNGIPPLHHPKHVPAHEAGWLKDKHVVFGIALGGEARAYPKRVLAWHELARDRVGGVELAIVYCTLCGTVVPYGSEVGGVRRTFGTSGLLYRSNKLLFDEETMSLWSTLEGRPVIGPLVGSGLELTAYPVVTTTWREWRDAHPGTTVLSRETGHERDYSEGAAYREYFATDETMFEVPRTDPRLLNKDEVLGLLLRPRGAGPEAPRRAVALFVELLERHPVRRLSFAGHDLVVVTSPEGANRVYEASGTTFVRRLADATVEDAIGRRWTVTEDALVNQATGEPRPRVPARRAFWFGWFAQFPETELVR
jgi:hypothetical protein